MNIITYSLVVFSLFFPSQGVPLEHNNIIRNISKYFQKYVFTFLPSIWLIAALSFSVHSATTFGLIS